MTSRISLLIFLSSLTAVSTCLVEPSSRVSVSYSTLNSHLSTTSFVLMLHKTNTSRFTCGQNIGSGTLVTPEVFGILSRIRRIGVFHYAL
jgi:hypothetical protein